MSSETIQYDPQSLNYWVVSNDSKKLELPKWAYDILTDYVEMLTKNLAVANTKLRDALDQRTNQVVALSDANMDYHRENAKLCKVAKTMYDHIKETCDICDEVYCGNWDEDNECCVFDTYLRELGIEVGKS